MILKDYKRYSHKILEQFSLKENFHIICSRAVSLKENLNSCHLELENGNSIYSEILVLANNRSISSLLKKYQNILIPTYDIITVYRLKLKKEFKEIPSLLRLANGHTSLSIFMTKDKSHLEVRISGPRFLLHDLGVGNFDINENISQQSKKSWLKVLSYHKEIIFPFLFNELFPEITNFLDDIQDIQMISQTLWGDCHPCDELPLVGEFGNSGRILGAAGFRGVGYSSLFFVASILKDLIFSSKSDELISTLMPKRFHKKQFFL